MSWGFTVAESNPDVWESGQTFCVGPSIQTQVSQMPLSVACDWYVLSYVQQPCVCTQLCTTTLCMYPALCSNPVYVPSYVQQPCVFTQLCAATQSVYVPSFVQQLYLCVYSAMCSNTVCMYPAMCSKTVRFITCPPSCVRLQQSFIQLAGGLYRASFNLLEYCTELHLTCCRTVQSFI